MRREEIELRHKQIAMFLGWWQEHPDEPPYAWWQCNGLSNTVATYELTFHKDWNQLMLAVEAIRYLPTLCDVPPKDQKQYIILDELKIGRIGIYLTAYKDSTAQKPAERLAFLYRHIPEDPACSNADSYIQAIWLGVADFCKEYIEYVWVETKTLRRDRKAL